MRSDGTYSTVRSAHGELPDPANAEAKGGRYEVLDGSSIVFRTGPFAGAHANVIPDYEATGADVIDLTRGGVFTSFRFDPA